MNIDDMIKSRQYLTDYLTSLINRGNWGNMGTDKNGVRQTGGNNANI